MADEIRHRKNTAEWIMWIALLPVFVVLLITNKFLTTETRRTRR